MLRKTLPALLIVLSFVFVAVSQDGSQLRQLLPTQEEVQGLLGDSWFVDGISELDPLPDGALVSAVATYDDGNTNNLVIALIDFDNVEASGAYLAAFADSPIVALVRDLKLEAEENPEAGLLSEFIIAETDEIVLLQLVNNSEQLLIRRGSLASFLRASPESGIDSTRLLEIAEFQIQIVLDFCATFESDAPPFC